MPHLVVSISGHGFGHVAQTAPILNLLHERMPQLRLTVRSSLPLVYLRSRIHAPFAYLQSCGDIGMVMHSALDVLVEESRAAYGNLHADWKARILEEAHLLRDIGADMVLSNVGYLPLAGAQRAGIQNAALCSLNWFDIYRHYCGDDAITAQIRECYVQADAFLRTTPAMPMNHLHNLVTVAPIAEVGHNRRDELDHILKLAKDEKLVLVSLGGINSRLPVERWLRIDGVRWLTPGSWAMHPDAIALESLPMSFSDLLASSDALLCKPGYGSFVEAACCGKPVLYVNRPDWPESPALIEWLNQQGVCREIPMNAPEQESFTELLAGIWNYPPHDATVDKTGRRLLQKLQAGYKPVIPEGVGQVADWIAERLWR